MTARARRPSKRAAIAFIRAAGARDCQLWMAGDAVEFDDDFDTLGRSLSGFVAAATVLGDVATWDHYQSAWDIHAQNERAD